MSATPPSPKYSYELHRFVDGSGDTFYQVKRRGFLGFYYWVRRGLLLGNSPRRFETREDAVSCMENDADNRRFKYYEKQRKKVRWVHREPIDL